MKATRLFLLLLFVPLFAFSQISDTTPAQLTSLDFSPAAIDTTAAPQTITLTLGIKDDLAGANYGCASFVSPSGRQTRYVCAGNRIAGTPLDGTYQETFTFPQFTESGVWTVQSINLWDLANNFTSVNTAALDAAGFPTQLKVTSNPDITPPIPASIAFTPNTADATSAATEIAVRLEVHDDLAGVDLAGASWGYMDWALIVASPTGSQKHYINNRMWTRVSGDDLTATWESSFTMPRYSEPGSWQIQQVSLSDRAGNNHVYAAAELQALGITPAIDVSCATPDLTPPQLMNLTFTPAFINTSLQSQSMTVDLTISDDRAGVDFSYDTPQLTWLYGGYFTSPSGRQLAYLYGTPSMLVSGTPLNGLWEGQVHFPRYSEAGTWRLTDIIVKDAAMNTAHFTTAQLAAAGMPTQLVVIQPSLVIDGIVTPGTSTITDETFGARAQLTVPDGVLSPGTQVAIDVLSEPLAIPSPTGYAAAGTCYVNIELIPTPSFPLPAPGITLVLPLVNPLIAGQVLDLFRVDPASGTFVPVLNPSGYPVRGTVDAGGLSATFPGVTHLSTFAAFAPLSTTMTVAIDIKPGEAIPTINPKASGTTPVAILGSATFDPVTLVNRSSLTFGHAGSEASLSKCNPGGEDVNGDGRLDLVCHFTTAKAAFQSGDTRGFLRGTTTANVALEGSDTVRVK